MTEKDEKSHSIDKQKEQDSALWAEITKDVTPLEGKNSAPPSSKKRSSSTKPKNRDHTTLSTELEKPPKKDNTALSEHREIDHRTKQRLKRGQLEIEGRVDLHGMTQNQAYDALVHFIPKAYSQGKRCILVVTGKGHQRHGDPSLLERTTGILKQKTPEWLNEPPLDQYILNIQTARPKHGGEGALYVLLRRNR